MDTPEWLTLLNFGRIGRPYIYKCSTYMYFKGDKTLSRMLVSTGPEREVSFKGKQYHGHGKLVKTIPKVSTKLDAF